MTTTPAHDAPAGPHWQRALRLDRVSGIAGVVLCAADAPALAERWAALIGVAATSHANGRLQLQLPGRFIAFEAAAPGAANGLTEVVLQAVDPAAVWQQAAALSLAARGRRRSMRVYVRLRTDPAMAACDLV